MTQRARQGRVGELLRDELAEVIGRRLEDPRLRLVSVTAVEMSGDLQHARVYLSCTDPEADAAAVLKVVQRAAGFIRRQLVRQNLGLRHLPELHFCHDDSMAHGARIDQLLGDVDHHPEEP